MNTLPEPNISVIVPAYNARAYIDDTLAAIFRQTHSPAEVIVVDDGSLDGTAGHVNRAFPQVTVVRQDNGGPSRARNTGAEQASSEWLAFCDSDDLWLPWRLEAQVGLIQTEAALGTLAPALVGGHTLLAGADDAGLVAERAARSGRPPDRKPREVTLADLLVRNFIRSSTVLVRARVFRDLGGFDPHSDGAEDWDLWLRIAAGHRVIVSPVPLSVYRSRPGSYSRSVPRLTRATIGVMQKWLPDDENQLPVMLYRRACTRRVLSLIYRHSLARLSIPGDFWGFQPVACPWQSAYGLTLWAARKVPFVLRPAAAGYGAVRAWLRKRRRR